MAKLFPIQGTYNSVPFTLVNMPNEDDNVQTIYQIIDLFPTLDSLSYIGEGDEHCIIEPKAIIILSFNQINLEVKDLAYKLFQEVFPHCGVDSYSSREIGNHTIATFEIPF